MNPSGETADTLEAMLDEAFEGTGLTQPQYNVLRILNGIYPGAHARGEIARRMMRRAPDLTRMLDRLVKMGLVEREKGEQDHRQSLARITPKGRKAHAGAVHARVQREVEDLLAAPQRPGRAAQGARRARRRSVRRR